MPVKVGINFWSNFQRDYHTEVTEPPHLNQLSQPILASPPVLASE